jgi:hypothetical protein
MKQMMLGFALALACIGAPAAQAPAPKADPPPAAAADAKAPPLSDVQKLQIQNLAQRLELAQTQIRAAQLEYERSAQALTQLVHTLQVPGFDLDLQRLEYVAKPPAPGKTPDQKDPPK